MKEIEKDIDRILDRCLKVLHLNILFCGNKYMNSFYQDDIFKDMFLLMDSSFDSNSYDAFDIMRCLSITSNAKSLSIASHAKTYKARYKWKCKKDLLEDLINSKYVLHCYLDLDNSKSYANPFYGCSLDETLLVKLDLLEE